MKKIEKLTGKQVARFDEFKTKWLNIGLKTGPCDRKAMEAAVDLAYQCAGLKAPQIKIWLGSPLAGAIACHLLTHTPINLSIRDQVWGQVWNQVTDQAGNQVRDQAGGRVWDQVSGQVFGQVWDQVTDQVWAKVCNQVGKHVRDQVGDQVKGQVWAHVWNQVSAQVYNACYGSQEANWLAFYNYFGEVCGLECVGKLNGLELLSECGWWFPFEGAAILTELPTKICCDDRGRLHSNEGMAIEYPDGWGISAVHGVRLPHDVISNPESITTERIEKERNAEIRRVMIERFPGGQSAYLMASGAKEISSDDYGVLYRKEIPGDEPLVMVKVVNSTPERDGSFKDYFIRVDPKCTTARQAVAWTFSKEEEQYEPAIET